MKIILENFGPIKRVEFDLSKDLNVIFGKNNIGKSYAITALYIILKHLLAEFGGNDEQHILRLSQKKAFHNSFQATADSLNFSNKDIQPSPIEEAVESVRTVVRANSTAQQIDLSLPIAGLFRDAIRHSLEDALTNSFRNCFESIEGLATTLCPFLIHVQSEPLTLTFQAKGNMISLDTVKLPALLFEMESMRSTEGDSKGNFTENSSQLEDQAFLQGGLGLLFVIFRAKLLAITNSIYFLPASRSGLYQALNNLSSLFAELSKNRNLVTKGFSLPSFSETVADYFIHLSNIKKNIDLAEVSIIAKQMEQELLGGEVHFNEQTKKLYFRQQLGERVIEMDLSFSSSMISEIAPIVAYLKYILPRDILNQPVNNTTQNSENFPPSLIFIEEPEAHLHPEVQVKLMEFFARLTKHNVKVVMTSHSNYMFNKLSNLLLTNELEPEKVGSYLMRATPEGSVMDPFAMRAEEDGIADENFVDVAEQLYNERLEAYDKLNAKQ